MRTLPLLCRTLVLLLALAAIPAQSVANAAYRGNVQSGIYHNSSCRYFHCKKCTASFASAAAARAAGYRACKVCKG